MPIPFTRAPPSPNAITLGLESQRELGGTHSLHSISPIHRRSFTSIILFRLCRTFPATSGLSPAVRSGGTALQWRETGCSPRGCFCARAGSMQAPELATTVLIFLTTTWSLYFHNYTSSVIAYLRPSPQSTMMIYYYL